MEAEDLFPVEIWEKIFEEGSSKHISQTSNICDLFATLVADKAAKVIQRKWRKVKQEREQIIIKTLKDWPYYSPLSFKENEKERKCFGCRKQTVLPHFLFYDSKMGNRVFDHFEYYCRRCFSQGLISLAEEGRLPYMRDQGLKFQECSRKKVEIPEGFNPPLSYYCYFYHENYIWEYIENGHYEERFQDAEEPES